MKQQSFPLTLASFTMLPGGRYGMLNAIARTSGGGVELALGGDFVTLTPTQWAALRSAVDQFFGVRAGSRVVATDGRGEPVFIEDETPPKPRAKATRRRAEA